jgi:hypothetical protein
MGELHICICIGFADTQSPPSSTLVTLHAFCTGILLLFWHLGYTLVAGRVMFGVVLLLFSPRWTWVRVYGG